jgi:hypothetical protein
VEYGLFSGFFMNKFACRKKMTIDIFLIFQLNVCDGCDTPLNLMNIEQERLYGFGSYLSIRCTTIVVLFYLFHSPVALPFHPIQGKQRERFHDGSPKILLICGIWII